MWVLGESFMESGWVGEVRLRLCLFLFFLQTDAVQLKEGIHRNKAGL